MCGLNVSYIVYAAVQQYTIISITGEKTKAEKHIAMATYTLQFHQNKNIKMTVV